MEYEDDDGDNYAEDVEWYAGDCDEELDDTAYTAGTPTDDPELLEQFDGNLDDADVSASQVYASASRSFQEARELLARVKSARGYFPVVELMSCCSFIVKLETGDSQDLKYGVYRIMRNGRGEEGWIRSGGCGCAVVIEEDFVFFHFGMVK